MLVTNQTTQDIYFGPLHLDAGIGQTLTVDDTSDTSLYLTSDEVADALNNAYNSSKFTVSGEAQPFPRPTGTPQLLHGDGSPEGVLYASQGSLFMRRDGTGANSLYVKTTGVTLDTGWEAFGAAVGGAGTEWDYAQYTASVSVTATTEASANTLASGNGVYYDGTKLRLEFSSSGYKLTGGTESSMSLVFLRDSTVLGQMVCDLDHNDDDGSPLHCVTYDTPPAGTHTYTVKAFLSAGGTVLVKAGAGGSGTLLPGYLRVTKA